MTLQDFNFDAVIDRWVVPALKWHSVDFDDDGLADMDFRALEVDAKELHRFLQSGAGRLVPRGTAFGEQGRGFASLNTVFRHVRLDEALRELRHALQKLGNLLEIGKLSGFCLKTI